METTLIIIVIIACCVYLKGKIGEINTNIEILKYELKRQSENIKKNIATEETPKIENEIIPEPNPITIPKEEPEKVVIQEEVKPISEVIEILPPEPVKQEEETPLLQEPQPYIPVNNPRKEKEKNSINYEKYIGENLFGKIGILILVVGVGLFVKYAIDKNWINETMRTILGFICGIALLLIAERLKAKYRTFSSLLAGGSFAIFYVTVAIAYHYYTLFSQPVAFAILVVTTVFMSALSILYNRRELAIIALVGGFIAPFLVSTGEGNYIILFSYILILNIGMFGLSFYQKWAELPIISFLFTYGIMLLFTLNEYWEGVFTESMTSGVPVNLLIFSSLFYFIFLLPILSILKSESPKFNRILLILIAINNFVYLALGLYFINQIHLSFKADGLLPLFIAIVNTGLILWLKKENKDFKLLIHTMLGIVLTFVSIAIPIQLDGNYITLLWASEIVVLIWLYIKSGIKLYEYFSLALIILTVLSILSNIYDYSYMSVSSKNLFVTNLYAGLAFLVTALLMKKHKPVFDKASILRYYPWNAILLVVSALTIYIGTMFEIAEQVSNSTTCIKAMLLFTNGYIFLLTLLLRKRFRINHFSGVYKTGMFLSLLIFAIDSYLVSINSHSSGVRIALSWSVAFLTIATFIETGRQYYIARPNSVSTSKFTVYITILATLCWLCLENLFINQFNLSHEYSAGFSIALSFAGLIQMALGMRLHLKTLRIISLFTFGVVLVKLILIDLWAMPTVGKIIVFIILGAILLVLSFLYQKLKDVLFKDDKKVE